MKKRSKLHLALRRVGLGLSKRFTAVRNLRSKYYDRSAVQYEKQAAKAQTNPHAVIFEAFLGRRFADSPKAIYEAMCADPRFDDWTFYWAFKKSSHRKKARRDPSTQRAQLILRGTEEYFDAFQTCKYWVTNNRVSDYITPKADQVFVQTWHGTPLKKLGCDQVGKSGSAYNSNDELAKRYKVDAEKWTFLLSPSPYTSEHLSTAFGVEGARKEQVVLESGYPRNDYIVNTLTAPDAEERVRALKLELGIPEEDLDKKVLLYAPTWREDQYVDGGGYQFKLDLDIDELQKRFGDEWIILLRTHYYVASKIDTTGWEGFVYNVSGKADVNPLYCMADALCTDYSSVFYDYANTKRPLLFFWPDREHYEQELHEFYMDPETIPGPKCETTEEFCEALAAIDSWYDEYGEAYEQFQQDFCPWDDGHASERVIEAMLEAGSR